MDRPFWVVNILGWVLLLMGCNYRHEKTGLLNSEQVSFTVVQQLIFGPKCLRCHTGSEGPGAVDLSSYKTTMASDIVVPFDSASSRIYKTVASGSMPKGQGPLSPSLLSLLRDWIDLGAHEGEAPLPLPVLQPTYQSIFTNIFEPRCIGCHDGTHATTELDLRTFASLMGFEGDFFKAVEPGDPESSTLFLNVSAGLMPPTGASLNEPQIEAIQDWILSGAKETNTQ